MAREEQKQFKIEDAQLIFRNFAGQERTFNPAGERNFAVILTPEAAETLAADGFNVKMTKPREEDDEPEYYIQVKISYKFKPPRVVMMTSRARTNLDESQLEVLDYADIKTVDIIANGSNWDVNGKQGTSAYLKSMFVTIEEDDLERKYAINETEV